MKYIIFLMILSGCYVRTDPGTGQKVGRIVKVSKQGLIFKTWEATLVRGGLNDGSGVMGMSFDFTIEDDSLAMQAIQLMQDQSEVILHYRIEGISSITRSESYLPNFCESLIKKLGD